MKRSELTPEEAHDVEQVEKLAQDFVTHLRAISDEVDRKHVHGAQSSEIQALVTEWLVDQHGFRSEVIGVFADGRRLRPDFVGSIDGGGGILVEVERGGTVTNNHDLKDLWKCHLCATTKHLFLLVPNANWAKTGAVRERPFRRSSSRLRSFFDDARVYVDVLSAWVIGYGLVDDVLPEVATLLSVVDAAAST